MSEYRLPEVGRINCSNSELVLYEHATHWRLPLFYLQYLTLYESIWLINLVNMYRRLIKDQNPSVINDGWFYLTQTMVNNDIPDLSPRIQTDIIKGLKEKGVLEVNLRGVPAKNYYRINFNILVSWANQYELNKKSKNPNNSTDLLVGRTRSTNKVDNNVVSNNESSKEDKSSLNDPSDRSVEVEESSDKKTLLTRRKLRDKIEDKKLIEPTPKPYEFDSTNLSIIKYWNSKPELKKRNLTKNESCKKLSTLLYKTRRGSLQEVSGLRGHSLLANEIFEAIDNFVESTQDPHWPDLKTVTLDMFLEGRYFTDANKQKLLYNHLTKESAEQFRQTRTPKEASLATDRFPRLTELLINYYKRRAFGTTDHDISNKVKNQFIEGAKKLQKIQEGYTKRGIYLYGKDFDEVYIEYLDDTLAKDKTIFPGLVVSEGMLNGFESYLRAKDYLSTYSGPTYSIYNPPTKSIEEEVAEHQYEIDTYFTNRPWEQGESL